MPQEFVSNADPLLELVDSARPTHFSRFLEDKMLPSVWWKVCSYLTDLYILHMTVGTHNLIS